MVAAAGAGKSAAPSRRQATGTARRAHARRRRRAPGGTRGLQGGFIARDETLISKAPRPARDDAPKDLPWSDPPAQPPTENSLALESGSARLARAAFARRGQRIPAPSPKHTSVRRHEAFPGPGPRPPWRLP